MPKQPKFTNQFAKFGHSTIFLCISATTIEAAAATTATATAAAAAAALALLLLKKVNIINLSWSTQHRPASQPKGARLMAANFFQLSALSMREN
jgi:predicted membrane channel-forming protein YqfA (hemolysin III family)